MLELIEYLGRFSVQTLIELHDFTCIRDDSPLFKPLHMEVNAGDIWQVVGPNGAGKTTLLRAICGLFDHVEGQFQWAGEDIKLKAYERARSLLYLGHHPGVKAALTALENLTWFVEVNGLDCSKGALERALQQVGLYGYEQTLCHQMSAGQQRRVALARLYLAQGKIWVLDEPFTAIDVQGVARLEAKISEYAASGGCVILTSHQPVSCEGLKTLSLERQAPVGLAADHGGVNAE